jgi:hypothetical protein
MDGQYTPIIFRYFYGGDDFVEYYLTRELTSAEKTNIRNIIKSETEDYVTSQTEKHIDKYLESLGIVDMNEPIAYEVNCPRKILMEY